MVDDDLTDDVHYTIDAQGNVKERERGDLIGRSTLIRSLSWAFP